MAQQTQDPRIQWDDDPRIQWDDTPAQGDDRYWWNKPLSDAPSRAAQAITKGSEYPHARFTRFMGDVLTQSTAPLDVALNAATFGAYALPKMGVTAGTTALRTAARGLSGATAVRGGYHVARPEADWSERAFGALEAGLGAYGARAPKGKVGQVADDVAGGIPPPPPRPSPTPSPDFQPGFRGRTTGGAQPGDIPVTAAEYPPVRPPSAGSAWDDFNHQVFRDQEVSAGRPDPGPRRAQETGMVPFRGERMPSPEPVPQAVGEAAFRIVRNYHDGVIPPQITNDRELVAYAESLDPEGMRAVQRPPVTQPPAPLPPTVMDKGDVIDQGTGEVLGQETVPPVRPSINPAATTPPPRPVATDVRQDTSQRIRDLFRPESQPPVASPTDPVLQRFAEEGFATQPPTGPTQEIWAELPIRPAAPTGPAPDLPLRPSIPPGDEPSRVEKPPAPQPREGEDEADARLREYLEKEDVVLPESQDIQMPPETPSEMRVPGTRVGGGMENIAIGPAMEDTRILDVLGTALYTQDRPSTVVKELFQNSSDEMKITGNSSPIRVLFRNSAEHPTTQANAKSIVIKDFGRGLTPEQLYTIFTDVGKTGKGNEPLASGGFGFAKAAPLLGGDYVRVRSVVQDPESGSKVAYSFEGNPEQLKNQTVGVPVRDELVDDSTPTGMEVEVYFPEDKSFYSAENMLKIVTENSPHIKNVQFYEDYYPSSRYAQEFLETGTVAGREDNVETLQGQPIPPRQATLSLPNANITFYYQLDNLDREKTAVVYLNKGLFTAASELHHGQPRPHVPPKIVIDIDPTVEEGAEGYPFGLNREQISKDLTKEINTWIRDNITDPAESARTGELIKVFNALKPAGRNAHVILDSGKRYENLELRRLVNSPNLRVVAGLMEDMLVELDRLFPTEQLGKTVKHGFIMADDNMGGINIANPAIPYGQPREFAILVNVLGLISRARNPQEAAEMIAHTILHEFNHNMVRSEGGGYTWQFLQTDSRFGTRGRANVVDAILRAITGPTGQYDGGIQELLSDYKAARGRPDTEVDTLSRQRASEWLGGEGPSRISSGDRDAGTGTSGGGGKPPRKPPVSDEPAFSREEPPPPGDEGKRRRTSRYKGQYTNPVSRNWANRVDKLDAEGAPDAMYREILPKGLQNQPLPGQTWRGTVIDAINRLEEFTAQGGAGGGRGTPPPGGHGPFATGDPRTPGGRGRTPTPPEIPISKFRDYWEFFRHALSGDLPFLTSAAWRQAAPLFGTSAWRKAFMAGARAYRSQDVANAILADLRNNVVHQKRWVNGRRISIFDELKVARSDATTMTGSEKGFRSALVEKLPFGIGKHYAGNNRSFNVFLEAVRTYTLEEWLKAANAIDGTRITNKVDADKLAKTLNELTGHGSLTFRTPIVGRMGLTETGLRAEQAGKWLSEVFWTPRQLVRDARMMNPLNYVMTPDLMRKQYAYGAARRLGVWLGFTGLASLGLGARISLNPMNSDFGKARIGNTRLDMGTGMLQWFVLAARQYLGHSTSSSTGITREFGSSPVAQTREGAIYEFFRNRIHPTLSLGGDFLMATEENPFYLGSSLLERAVAMPVSDMIDLAANDPEIEEVLLGVIGALTSSGTLTYGRREYGKPEYDFEKVGLPEWKFEGGNLPGSESILPFASDPWIRSMRRWEFKP